MENELPVMPTEQTQSFVNGEMTRRELVLGVAVAGLILGTKQYSSPGLKFLGVADARSLLSRPSGGEIGPPYPKPKRKRRRRGGDQNGTEAGS